jgi:AcrR family transcriptional regulator
MPRRSTPQRKPRREYHHGNLRSALMEAAVKLLEKNVSGTFTLREAARSVGVDHRAMYRHFADREALVEAIAEQGFCDLVDAIRLRLADVPPDASSRLLAFGQAYTHFAATKPAQYRMMTSPRRSSGRTRPHDAADTAFDMLKNELAAGIARDELIETDVTDAALALWSTMHGFTDLIAVGRITVRRTLFSAFAARILERSLLGFVKP